MTHFTILVVLICNIKKMNFYTLIPEKISTSSMQINASLEPPPFLPPLAVPSTN